MVPLLFVFLFGINAQVMAETTNPRECLNIREVTRAAYSPFKKIGVTCGPYEYQYVSYRPAIEEDEELGCSFVPEVIGGAKIIDRDSEVVLEEEIPCYDFAGSCMSENFAISGFGSHYDPTEPPEKLTVLSGGATEVYRCHGQFEGMAD